MGHQGSSPDDFFCFILNCLFNVLLLYPFVNPSLQVFKDGSYDLADMNSIAGRTFLVLGRLLTGAKVSDIWNSIRLSLRFVWREGSMGCSSPVRNPPPP